MPRINLFACLLTLAVLVGCGRESGKTSLQSVIEGSAGPGFACAVTFSVPLAKDTEEFTVTIRPSGTYLGAPTQVGSPTGFSIISSKTEKDVVTVRAKAKFSFTYVASVADARGRRTQCSNGITIQETPPVVK